MEPVIISPDNFLSLERTRYIGIEWHSNKPKEATIIVGLSGKAFTTKIKSVSLTLDGKRSILTDRASGLSRVHSFDQNMASTMFTSSYEYIKRIANAELVEMMIETGTGHQYIASFRKSKPKSEIHYRLDDFFERVEKTKMK